jgi:hypothetical protein
MTESVSSELTKYNSITSELTDPVVLLLYVVTSELTDLVMLLLYVVSSELTDPDVLLLYVVTSELTERITVTRLGLLVQK